MSEEEVYIPVDGIRRLAGVVVRQCYEDILAGYARENYRCYTAEMFLSGEWDSDLYRICAEIFGEYDLRLILSKAYARASVMEPAADEDEPDCRTYSTAQAAETARCSIPTARSYAQKYMAKLNGSYCWTDADVMALKRFNEGPARPEGSLTKEELAERFGLSVWKVYRMLNRHSVPRVKPRGMSEYVFMPTDEFLERMRKVSLRKKMKRGRK